MSQSVSSGKNAPPFISWLWVVEGREHLRKDVASPQISAMDDWDLRSCRGKEGFGEEGASIKDVRKNDPSPLSANSRNLPY